jgi:hypothetical protein
MRWEEDIHLYLIDMFVLSSLIAAREVAVADLQRVYK